jgi:U3 small nucleolar RNA-associated protein 4
MVKFWDSRTCTQLQSFQGHGADILCLAISPVGLPLRRLCKNNIAFLQEGTTVYTSGVDQKISQFSLIRTLDKESAHIRPSSHWVQSGSRRMHSHDVRALVTWPPYNALPPLHKRQFPIDIAPILASGGLDMSVVVTPAALPMNTVVAKITNPLSTSVDSTFENSYHRRLAYTSGPSSTCAVQIARRARLVTCMRDTGLGVWKILRKQVSSDEEITLNAALEICDNKSWEKVLDMELNVQTNLVASAISDDGRWLVASDLYETKLFRLENDVCAFESFFQKSLTFCGKVKGGPKPKRIRNFSSILQAHLPGSPSSTGGLAFSFTPDSSKLVMSTALSTHVLIIDLGIDTDGQQPRVLRRFDHHRMRNVTIRDRFIRGRKARGDVEMGENKRDDEEDSAGPVVASILRMAISADGQWLATSDDHARTHIFNLDSVQVTSSFLSCISIQYLFVTSITVCFHLSLSQSMHCHSTLHTPIS